MPKDEHHVAREEAIETTLASFLKMRPGISTCAVAWRAAFEAGEAFAAETVLKHYTVELKKREESDG
jgi:hypothetical protein